jgi:hypothetical protein
MRHRGAQHVLPYQPVALVSDRLQGGEARQQAGALLDRVVALPRPCAMRGATSETDVGMDGAAATQLQLVVARLEHHGDAGLAKLALCLE